MVKLNSEVVKLNIERKVQCSDSFLNPKEFNKIFCIVAKRWKISFHLKVDRLFHLKVDRKRGGLVVCALAFSARGHGFDPCSRRGNISESEHVFLSVIYRDDTR